MALDIMYGGAAFFQSKFTSTTRVKRYLAVHDEIQPQRGRNAHPYLVHGVLFIPWELRGEVYDKLMDLRQGYQHRIEYRNIKVEHSPNFQVADRWLQWFKNEAIHYCTFKVFAVDQEGFQRFPYRGDPYWPFHIWKNTLSSFVAGITWTLGRPKGILLDIACDSSGDEDFLAALQSLPRDLKHDIRIRRQRQFKKIAEARSKGLTSHLKPFPMVRVHGTVRTHSSDPAKATPGFQDETEFIQLTDVILGSLWDAIQARKVDERGRAGRVRLSREWRENEQTLLPWGLRLPYHRVVSVSMYPDEHGLAYPATVLAEPPGQQRFDFYDELFNSRTQRKKRRNEQLDEAA